MIIDVRNLLTEKAKTRKDGVYSYQTFLYAVKNNRMIAYSDYYGNINSCHGAFDMFAGKVDRYDRKKELTGYIK
jgi:hypothetical protein